MKYTNTIKLSSFILMFALLITACGDDPASSVDEDPPEFPEFENIDADLSYFLQNSQSTNQENTSNFTEAYFYATGLSSVTSAGLFYTSFFGSADQNGAEFNDGTWRWEYSYSFEGETASIVLISQEIGDEIVWEMNWSYSDGQGNSIEDYTMIEGSSAKDGSSGTWTFNNLDPESNQEEPFMETTWERTGEDNFESTTQYYGDGTGVQTYTFTQNGNIFDVTFSDTDSQNNIYVHWNTALQTGYYQEGTETANRYCWNDSFTDVDCSTVGY